MAVVKSIQLFEALGEISQTGITYLTALTASVQIPTSESSTDWLILWRAQVKGDSANNAQINVRARADGSGISLHTYQNSSSTSDWKPCGGVGRVTGKGSAFDVIIDFRVNSGLDTVRLRNVQVIAIRTDLPGSDFQYTENNTEQTNIGTAWATIETLTWTPETAGDYLVIWCVEGEPETGSNSIQTRIEDSQSGSYPFNALPAYTGSGEHGGHYSHNSDSGEIVPQFGIAVITYTESSNTLTLKAKGTNTNADVNRTRIAVMSLEGVDFASVNDGVLGNRTLTPSASTYANADPTDSLKLSLTNGVDWIVLNSLWLTSNGTTDRIDARLRYNDDGTEATDSVGDSSWSHYSKIPLSSTVDWNSLVCFSDHDLSGITGETHQQFWEVQRGGTTDSIRTKSFFYIALQALHYDEESNQNADLQIEVQDLEIDPDQTGDLQVEVQDTDESQNADLQVQLADEEIDPAQLADLQVEVQDLEIPGQDADLQVQLADEEIDPAQNADLEVEVQDLEIDPAQTADLEVEVQGLEIDPAQTADLQVEIQDTDEGQNADLEVEVQGLEVDPAQTADLEVEVQDLEIPGQDAVPIVAEQVDEGQNADLEIEVQNLEIDPAQTANLQVQGPADLPQDADLQVEVQDLEIVPAQTADLQVQLADEVIPGQDANLQIQVQVDEGQNADLQVEITDNSPQNADLEVEVQDLEIDPAQTADLEVEVQGLEVDPAQTADLQVKVTAPDLTQDANLEVQITDEALQDSDLEVQITDNTPQDADLQVEVQGQEIPGQDADLQVQLADEDAPQDADVPIQFEDEALQDADLRIYLEAENLPQDANLQIEVQGIDEGQAGHVVALYIVDEPINADLQIQTQGHESEQICSILLQGGGDARQDADLQVEVQDLEIDPVQTADLQVKVQGIDEGQDANLQVQLAADPVEADANLQIQVTDDASQNSDLQVEVQGIDESQNADLQVEVQGYEIDPAQTANCAVQARRETWGWADLQVEVQGYEIDPAQTANLQVQLVGIDLPQDASVVYSSGETVPQSADFQVEVHGQEIDPAQTANLQIEVQGQEVPQDAAPVVAELVDLPQNADLQIALPTYTVPQNANLQVGQIDRFAVVNGTFSPLAVQGDVLQNARPILIEDALQPADFEIRIQGVEVDSEDLRFQNDLISVADLPYLERQAVSFWQEQKFPEVDIYLLDGENTTNLYGESSNKRREVPIPVPAFIQHEEANQDLTEFGLDEVREVQFFFSTHILKARGVGSLHGALIQWDGDLYEVLETGRPVEGLWGNTAVAFLQVARAVRYRQEDSDTFDIPKKVKLEEIEHQRADVRIQAHYQREQFQRHYPKIEIRILDHESTLTNLYRESSKTFSGPYPIHAYVNPQPEQRDLTEFGLDEQRDLLVTFATTLLSDAGILEDSSNFLIGGIITWDDDRFEILSQHRSTESYWGNTNIPQHITVTANRYRDGA